MSLTTTTENGQKHSVSFLAALTVFKKSVIYFKDKTIQSWYFVLLFGLYTVHVIYLKKDFDIPAGRPSPIVLANHLLASVGPNDDWSKQM